MQSLKKIDQNMFKIESGNEALASRPSNNRQLNAKSGKTGNYLVGLNKPHKSKDLLAT